MVDVIVQTKDGKIYNTSEIPNIVIKSKRYYELIEQEKKRIIREMGENSSLNAEHAS